MNRILIFLLALIVSLNVSAQDLKSLDEFSTVKSIAVESPSHVSSWDNCSDYKYILLYEDVDNSAFGGSKSNLQKRAVLLSDSQWQELVNKVAAEGSYFIAKVPFYQTFYFPALQKESDLLETIENALFVHHLFLKQHPSMSVYESCGSRACPDGVGSHNVIGSLQISKKGDSYILIAGTPLNAGGTPIPWNINDLSNSRSFDESIIEMSASRYSELFHL